MTMNHATTHHPAPASVINEWRDMIAEECKGTPAEWEPFLERIGAAYELGVLDKLFDALFDDVEADTPASWNAHLDKLLAGLNES